MLTELHKEALISWLISQRNLIGIKQEELAKIINKPQSFVSKYENMDRKLTIFEFIEICASLNCDPSDEIMRLLNAAKS